MLVSCGFKTNVFIMLVPLVYWFSIISHIKTKLKSQFYYIYLLFFSLKIFIPLNCIIKYIQRFIALSSIIQYYIIQYYVIQYYIIQHCIIQHCKVNGEVLSHGRLTATSTSNSPFTSINFKHYFTVTIK